MGDVNGSTHPHNVIDYQSFPSPTPTEVELEKKRRRRNQRLVYGAVAFVLIHAAMVPLVVFFFMKAKSPTLRLRSVTFRDGHVVPSKTNSTFSLTLEAALVVKNPNFGWYRYQNSSVRFFYGKSLVGDGFVPTGKVGLKSRKTVEGIVVKLRVPSGLRPRNFTLNVRSKLEGKVTLLMMGMKKKRSSDEMDCLLPIYMKKKATGEIIC